MLFLPVLTRCLGRVILNYVFSTTWGIAQNDFRAAKTTDSIVSTIRLQKPPDYPPNPGFDLYEGFPDPIIL